MKRKRYRIFAYAGLVLFSAIAGAFLLVWAMIPAGCGAHTRLDPPKTDVSVTTTDYDTGGKPRTVTTEHVVTAGPGGQSDGDNAHVDAKGEAPTAQTKSIKTGGGKMDADGSASLAKSAAGRITAGIVALLLILGGMAGLYLKQPVKASAGTIAIGIALLCAAIWVSFAEYILAGAAVAGAIALWLTGFDAAKFREALRAARAGLADIAEDHPEAHKAAEAATEDHAEGSDLNTIAKIDLKDKLKN